MNHESESFYLKKYNEQTRLDLKDSMKLFEGRIKDEEKKKTIPFYLNDKKGFPVFYDEKFFELKIIKSDFINICNEIYDLLEKINQNKGTIKIEFKTKKTIKFALILLGKNKKEFQPLCFF